VALALLRIDAGSFRNVPQVVLNKCGTGTLACACGQRQQADLLKYRLAGIDTATAVWSVATSVEEQGGEARIAEPPASGQNIFS
jgi:hypothetical protein